MYVLVSFILISGSCVGNVYAGPFAILPPGGRLPNYDPSIPKTKQLQLRLDNPNPSGRLLERPAPP